MNCSVFDRTFQLINSNSVPVFQARGLVRTGQRSQDETRGRGLHRSSLPVFEPKRQHLQKLLPAGKPPQVCTLHFITASQTYREQAIITIISQTFIIFTVSTLESIISVRVSTTCENKFRVLKCPLNVSKLMHE